MTTSAEEQLLTEEEKVMEGRRFLVKFGIDETQYDDDEVKDLLVKIQEHRVVAAQVLSLGKTADSMKRILNLVPKGFTGQFVRNNPDDISRSQGMGWTVFNAGDTEEATVDGTITLADCILMVLPLDQYVGLGLAKDDRRRERRKRNDPKNFLHDAKMNLEVPVFDWAGDLPDSAEKHKSGSPDDDDFVPEQEE